MLGVLLVFGLIQIALSWRLARTLERAQDEREDLLQRALAASEVERRSIAADLHDGVVQDLVGLTFTLDGMAGGAASRRPRPSPTAAGTSRRSVRSLRSLLVEIYPPNLEDIGMAGALADLATAVGSDDDDGSTVQVDPAVHLAPVAQAAVYRVARESLSNARKHAQATDVDVRLTHEAQAAVLTVSDDGAGFDPRQVPDRAHGSAHDARRRDLRRREAHHGFRPRTGNHPTDGAARMIRVLIVDDHEMVRAGLATLLGRFDDLELVGAGPGRRRRDHHGRPTLHPTWS